MADSRKAVKAVAHDEAAQALLGRAVQGIEAVGCCQQRLQRQGGLVCRQAQRGRAVKARAPQQVQPGHMRVVAHRQRRPAAGPQWCRHPLSHGPTRHGGARP